MRSVAQHYQVVPGLGPSFLTFDLKLCSGTCVLLHEVGSDAHCCCVKCYETCLCWVNGDRVAVVPVPALSTQAPLLSWDLETGMRHTCQQLVYEQSGG